MSSGDRSDFPENPSRWNGTAKSMGFLFRLFRSFVIIISEFTTPFAAFDAMALRCMHSRVTSISSSLKTYTAPTPGYVLVYPVRATSLALSLISKVCLSFMWS